MLTSSIFGSIAGPMLSTSMMRGRSPIVLALFILLSAVPSGLIATAELNPGKLYYADSDAKTIMRANLDGTSIEQVPGSLGHTLFFFLGTTLGKWCSA